MDFDVTKTYPHPVLRPSTASDDYPNAEFQVEINMVEDKQTGELIIDADFTLSDPGLLKLVERGDAKYALLAKSPKTFFRTALTSSEPSLQKVFPFGQMSGKVLLSPYLVSMKDLVLENEPGWHEDYHGNPYRIPIGSVLAEGEPKEYWTDIHEDEAISSILQHRSGGEEIDCWELDLEGEKITILMSPELNEQFESARDQTQGKEESIYLLNGLYLPVIIEVLLRADSNPVIYESRRWYTCLDNRLMELQLKPLGNQEAARHVDAQKLLGMPFPKMPIISAAQQ